MRVEETFDIAQPQETVFNRMNNVGDVGYCISGVKRVEVINDRESKWKIEQRFGFMARTFDMDAKITELEPPSRIAFSSTCPDVEVNGQITFEAVEPALTRCNLEMEIDVVGALAPLVEIFAKGPQQALIRETVANLRTALEGTAPEGASTTPVAATTAVEPEPAAAAPVAAPAPRGGLVARIRSWFGPRSSDSPA